ncbi:MAG: YgiQ family radical SAM protein [Candidatus Thermoplasmatota archaeon]
MISKKGKDFDIILISGEYYDDHPLSPVGIIARVLDAHGYNVGVIEKPERKEDYTKLGSPNLCFGVTSGSIDSMIHNYTPLKRKRILDPYSRVTPLPDRAVIVYCNRLREYFKGCKIIIGGVEASLRRFAHYDYWDNDIRRSILLDSRADILVYGNGEKQIIEIMKRIDNNETLYGVEGTCILSKIKDSSFDTLPSFNEVKNNPVEFCMMQRMLTNNKNLAQGYTNNYVLQFKYPKYTSEDLDWIYSLPFSRKLHPKSLLHMAQFSIVTHRGCIGDCFFCSIPLHQGSRIISRSEKNIIEEIKKLTHHKLFKGYIDDLGGPTANMYGMDCKSNIEKCNQSCLKCNKIDITHERLINLLKKTRETPGIKKIFIRSGIRYDLALNNYEYIREISKHHISGCLKIAPEHLSPRILRLMNKDNTRLREFIKLFNDINKDKKQDLRYYFMIGHPGESIETILELKKEIKKQDIRNIEQFQLFTPTPMTISTCMYWTGLNPYTLERVYPIRDYHTKKRIKRIMLNITKKDKTSIDESAGIDS